MVIYKKITVGIFTREAQNTYQWFIDLLVSPEFKRVVLDVRPVHVSSQVCGGSTMFDKEISKCTFAVLYHTKLRGRLNITDVTDSLYDLELRDLSTRLGKTRVIVLVDDVENDDPEVTSRILREQPSIAQWAGLLTVLNKDEKASLGRGAGGWTSGSSSYHGNGQLTMKQKIEKMKLQMREARRYNWPVLVSIFAVFLGSVLLIIIIVFSTKRG